MGCMLTSAADKKRETSAASGSPDISYSKFIAGLKAKNIDLNRKVLADIAVKDPTAFAALVSEVKA